jgi:uncharacterized protein (DUF885 family)
MAWRRAAAPWLLTAAWATFLLAGGCALATTTVRTAGDSLAARTRLSATLRDHWDYVHQEWPELAAWAGLQPEKLPDVTWDGAKEHGFFARAALRALDGIDFEALDEPEYLTWLSLRWDMTMLSDRSGSYWTDLSELAPERSPLGLAADLLANHPLASAEDVDGYLALLDSVASLADAIRHGVDLRRERGVVLAKALVPRAAAYVRSLVAPPAASPFAPAVAQRDELDSSLTARLDAGLSAILVERVNPALIRLASYLEGAYAAAAPATVGLGQYPGGRETYGMLVRHESTLDLTPAEAHGIGLQEVARLDSLVREAREAAGLPAARDSLAARLRDAWRGVPGASTPAESLPGRVAEQVALVVRDSPTAIALWPESPVVIDTMSTAESPWRGVVAYVPPSVSAPRAAYRLNLSRLRAGTSFSVPALVYRDLVPGGHVQAALQRENAVHPAFRRVARHGGFVDGWRIYALSLADSLSPALAPADRFAVRLWQLRAACGLVIDTGVNYLGWSRDEAIAFLRRLLPDDDESLERDFIIPAIEVPGSLVAGALGARELRALRRWAQQELGAGFDLRRFHAEVLWVGSVPLPVLGVHVEWWIWTQRAAMADTTRVAPDTATRSPRPMPEHGSGRSGRN